jgi:c-di-GMP-binding flagellar brake protein YcgR
MKIGATLKLQIGGTDARLTSELIGVEEDKYLIIRMPPVPSVGTVSNLLSLLYKGNTVVVRYMHRGTLFGFKSRIYHVIIDPVKLIFLEYPKKVEDHNLRTHRRVDCYLPASAGIAGNTIEGAITDISREGCHFTVEKSKVESSLILQIDSVIDISFQLPGVGKKLIIAAKQKIIKKDKNSINIGIEFINMDNKTEERLCDFLSTAGA